MLSRSIARGLSADARTLASTSRLALPIRDVKPLIACRRYLTRVTASTTRSPLVAPLFRSYATAQPVRRKAAGTKRPPKSAQKKKKPAKKAAPKKKKKTVRKPKKQPTELEQKRAKVRDLRQKALLNSPKQLPQTAYLVFTTQQSQKGTNITEQAKANSAAFKNLSASERERHESTAQANRRANERTIQNWIESHTPDEIREANNARRQLNRIAKEPRPAGAKQSLVAHGFNLLRDSRAPVKYDTPFIAFTRERWATGDFANTPVAEAGKALGREWKSLSSSDAKKYYDTAAANKARYDREYDRLFTRSTSRTAS